jgi:hypothetical protein
MIFRFHALTIASTSWSSKSPSTMVIFIRCGFDTEVWGFPTIVFYADQPNTLGCTYEAAFQFNFVWKLMWLVWFCIGLAPPYSCSVKRCSCS